MISNSKINNLSFICVSSLCFFWIVNKLYIYYPLRESDDQYGEDFFIIYFFGSLVLLTIWLLVYINRKLSFKIKIIELKDNNSSSKGVVEFIKTSSWILFFISLILVSLPTFIMIIGSGMADFGGSHFDILERIGILLKIFLPGTIIFYLSKPEIKFIADSSDNYYYFSDFCFLVLIFIMLLLTVIFFSDYYILF